MIQSPIINDYIKVNLDDGNGGEKTELSHKILLQIYVLDLHIDMLNKYDTGFYMAYGEKGLINISDSYLQLILPPQLQNMTHRNQVMYDLQNMHPGWNMPRVAYSLV